MKGKQKKERKEKREITRLVSTTFLGLKQKISNSRTQIFETQTYITFFPKKKKKKIIIRLQFSCQQCMAFIIYSQEKGPVRPIYLQDKAQWPSSLRQIQESWG